MKIFESVLSTSRDGAPIVRKFNNDGRGQGCLNIAALPLITVITAS